MTRLAALACMILASAAFAAVEEVRGPAWLSDCVVHYDRFDAGGSPIVTKVTTLTMEGSGHPVSPNGFIGGALDTTASPLTLKGPALGAHRPMTVMFWWALPRDLPIDGGFGLLGLTGRGYIGAFVRGKGEWCALQKPAGVLQVYYFPGIQNVNGIYDADLPAHLDLRAGQWHHTAIVFRRASTVQLYTDGVLSAEASAVGRSFSAQDALDSLQIGGGVTVDELLVLDRAIDGEQVRDYVTGMRRLREYLSK